MYFCKSSFILWSFICIWKRHHPLSRYAKFSEKLTILTPWYTRVRIRLEILIFWNILCTYLMDDPKGLIKNFKSKTCRFTATLFLKIREDITLSDGDLFNKQIKYQQPPRLISSLRGIATPFIKTFHQTFHDKVVFCNKLSIEATT